VVVVAGEEGSGKIFFVEKLACEIAMGKDEVLGFFPRGESAVRVVGILDTEQGDAEAYELNSDMEAAGLVPPEGTLFRAQRPEGVGLAHDAADQDWLIDRCRARASTC
jgi:hypothetical protein